jgi:multidrug efflux pump subunit AcrA (membrane-fusion protein)
MLDPGLRPVLFRIHESMLEQFRVRITGPWRQSVALLKRRKWFLVAALAVVIVGALAAGKFGGGEGKAESNAKSQPAAGAVVVTVDPVTPRPIRRTVPAVGSLWGWEEVPITPKVEGKVVRVHKFVGDVIKPGEVLAELDPTDFQLAVTEAERALELELAKLNLTRPPTADFDIAQLPSLVKADALEKQAQARAARLRAGGVAVTVEDRQQAETDAVAARASLRQAELEAKATLAAVRHRQASLATAKQRLADTKIVVPAPNPPAEPGVPAATEYVVSFRKIAAGEMVRIIPLFDAPPLFRLVIDRPLKLQLTLPERHLSEVRTGQGVELEVETYRGERFLGTISRVNRSVDRSSRTFTVEVVVPNADRRLSAGSFVKATIVTKTDDKAPTVPEESLVIFAGVTKVFVVADGKVHEVPVRTGVSVEVTDGKKKRTWVEVEGEIPSGAKVVTSGQSRLAEGVGVRVRE